MANDDQVAARGGLRPSMQPYGTIKRSYYKLTTSSTIGVWVGQPMDLDGNGNCTAISVGTGITIFTVGPALGFARDSRGQMGLPDEMSLITQAGYLPANVNAYVCIADDPNQEFIIQEMSSGAQLTTANIGNTTGFMVNRSTSGSTVTGSSHWELDPNTASATTVGCIRIVGLADNMNSDGTYNAVGEYAKWRVRISNHRLINPQASGVI
jgi:hypothetical protein